MLQKNPAIELVITDIVMPRLTGHQLLVKIRTHPDGTYNNLPVIVMTTADDNVDRNLAFSNGANDFITKPIDETELRARVHIHYKLARTIRELEESRQALAEQATTDPLTKLKNRRAFFENGAQNWAMSKRNKTDLSIIVADLDHFKNVNDSFGHHTGDEALIHVAKILARMTRIEDTVARIGGEEFAVLLPDTNRLGSAVLAERIRIAVATERLVVNDKHPPCPLSRHPDAAPIASPSVTVNVSDSPPRRTVTSTSVFGSSARMALIACSVSATSVVSMRVMMSPASMPAAPAPPASEVD